MKSRMIILLCTVLLTISTPTLTLSQDTDDGPLVLGAKVRLMPGIYVYDADDNNLGMLVDMSTDLIVYNHKINAFISFEPATGTLEDKFLCFESTDCTGQPLILTSLMYCVSKIGEIYVTGEKTIPAKKKTHSALDQYGCSSCERRVSETMTQVKDLLHYRG
jgi:hypothetical protein